MFKPIIYIWKYLYTSFVSNVVRFLPEHNNYLEMPLKSQLNEICIRSESENPDVQFPLTKQKYNKKLQQYTLVIYVAISAIPVLCMCNLRELAHDLADLKPQIITLSVVW